MPIVDKIDEQVWTKKTPSWQEKFKRRVKGTKKKYLGAALRRHTAAVKKTWKPTFREDVNVLLSIVAVNEALLEKEDAQLEERITDWQYKEYAGFAKMGSGKEKAKMHQKAGFRAAELGHHRRAERHFALAAAHHRLHKIRTAAMAAKEKHTAAGEKAKAAGQHGEAERHFQKAHAAHMALSKLKKGKTKYQYKS